MYTCIFFSFLARRIFLCAGLWHAVVHLAPGRVLAYARLRVRTYVARTITPPLGSVSRIFSRGGVHNLFSMGTHIIFVFLYTCHIAYKIWSRGGVDPPTLFRISLHPPTPKSVLTWPDLFF